MKYDKSSVAVIDAETDPFLYGRSPRPFAWGFMWGDIYIDFWGDASSDQLVDFLLSIKTPLIIYAHNGGKFDFIFLLRHLRNPVRIIHGRIVEAWIGIHRIRDSWAIIPIPLRGYQKEDIDYGLFERDKREAAKSGILQYLRSDCRYLYELCSAFIGRFGPRLTIGGTAARELRKLHPQYAGNEKHDERFRPFYFGGRVECFQTGVIEGDFKIYDVNSMYPHVMREFWHPLGTQYVELDNPRMGADGWLRNFPDCMYFAIVTGDSFGALPLRSRDHNGGLQFPHGFGTYYTTSHELRTAIELGLFKLHSIAKAFVPKQKQRFREYVDKFSAEKIAAKESKDKIAETFAKLLLNSAYGRFGINPDSFYDYVLNIPGNDLPEDFHTYELAETQEGYSIWRRKSESARYEDVSIAASITSAARSVLLRAIAGSTNVVYCDTDSVICQNTRMELHSSKLGHWKEEAKADIVAIAGKKLYAAFEKGSCIKSASKGVKLTPAEIVAIARGGSVIWKSDAPSFSLGGQARFISREVKSTAGV